MRFGFMGIRPWVGTMTLMLIVMALFCTTSAAMVPADQEYASVKVQYSDTTPYRGTASLDGIWRFMPAGGSAAQEPTANWGYIPVPGMWTESKRGIASIAQEGDGPPWNEDNVWASNKGWYEKKITIPKAWEGREVLLDLGRLSTDALIYVDGRECGGISWPSGQVPLTPQLVAGKESILRILVMSLADSRNLEAARKPGFIQKGESKQEGMGIIGHATLITRPKEGHVEDLFVRPSVEKGDISLDVSFKDVPTKVKTYFTAVIRDSEGRAVRRYETMKVLPAPEGLSDPSITLTYPGDGLKVWDYKAPNLYTVELTVSGPGYKDSIKQRFGYRDFRLQGKDFIMNGKPYRLRPMTLSDEWMDNNTDNLVSALKERLDAGFNLVEIWPWDPADRGKANYWEDMADAADRLGIPLMYPMTENPAQQVTDWARIKNHPSIIILTLPANRYGAKDDDNPLRIGNSANLLYSRTMYADSAKPGMKAIDRLRAMDPTRVATSHHGGAVGQFQATNDYLNFLPLQEREDWLSAWAGNGDKPYMAVEFGIPLLCYTYLRGRSFDRITNTEPWMTEFNAIYLGPDAYRLEQEGYRREIAAKFQGGQDYSSWHMNQWLTTGPAQDIYRLFIRNTWESWRAWGITGGMVPWDFGSPGDWVNSPAGRMMLAVNGPTLAYIGGKASSFTSKDHNFSQGSRVSKQVILINDEREVQPYGYSWTASVGGKAIASGKGSGTIGVGRNLFLPIGFTLPKVVGKTGGTITMSAIIGNHSHKDEFAFRVFPQAARIKTDPGVMVWDPEGDTTAMLRSLGYSPKAWDGKAYPGKVLVIGRNALAASDYTVPGPIDAFIKAGGVCTIFGQNPEYLRRNWGFRVARQVSRRAYPVASRIKHPVLTGLDAEDLRDWSGSGTLVAETANVDPLNDQTPPYGWHWGNTGSVSGGMIEKPHKGNWKAILEGEFDLAYTPLMEAKLGKGLMILCTLDLEGREGIEPAADLLARNLVSYAVSKGKRIPGEGSGEAVSYLGNGSGADLLASLGVVLKKAEGKIPSKGILVVGDGAGITKKALKAFIGNGGRVLILSTGAASGLLDFGIGEKETSGTSTIPGWPEVDGLSYSDLHLRSYVQLPLLTKAPKGGEIGGNGLLGLVRSGKGTAVVMAVGPGDLGAGKDTYFKFSTWRLNRSISQVLANLGASFEAEPGAALSAPVDNKKGAGSDTLYTPGFNTDFSFGDDPYRYFRW